VAWFLPRLWTIFPRAEARFPFALGTDSADSFRPASFTHFEAFFPCASPFAPTRVAPSRRPILSWVSASLERVSSTPWTLIDPPAP